MNNKINMININKFTTKLNTDKKNINFIFVLNLLFFLSLQYNFNYTIDFLSTDYLSLPILISLTSAHRTTENILNKINNDSNKSWRLHSILKNQKNIKKYTYTAKSLIIKKNDSIYESETFVY